MAGPDLGMAVGLNGSIWRLGNGRWAPMDSPVRVALQDVAMVSASEGYAVGDLGTIIEWDGSRWQRADSGFQNQPLLAVAAPAPGDAWAVKYDGVLLHREPDGSWIEFPAPHIERPVDIAFASSTRGMVVGRGGALELRDGLWRVAPGPRQSFISVAWGESAGNALAFAVSGNGLWRYDGNGWQAVTAPGLPVALTELNFNRVAPSPFGVLGLATNGVMLRMVAPPDTFFRPPATSFLALDMAGEKLGWAGGEAFTAAFVGTAGDSWTRLVATPPRTRVLDIDLADANDGWAVGSEPGAGTVADGRMWRWQGGQWQPWPIEKTWLLNFVEVKDANDAWASGGNVVAHWDGASWRQVTLLPGAAADGALSILHGGAQPEGWFGGRGTVFHLKDGAYQQQDLPDTVLSVDALAVPAADEGWAVTAEELYRYDGTKWTRVDLPWSRNARLLDVDASRKGSAWVLVDPDGLYHWTGFTWEWHDLARIGANAHPRRLRVLQPSPELPSTDVWLAGNPPTIARYRIVEPVAYLFMPWTGTGFR